MCNEEIAPNAGHIGSTESVAMLGDALGFDLDDITETIDPVVADEHVESDSVTVSPNDVAGIHQTAHGAANNEAVVTLDLQMYVGASAPHDQVQFVGDPEPTITIEGGYPGDIATSAVVINVAPRVIKADAGLACMLDLTIPSFTSVEKT
jgi:hypothetical protein